MRTVEDLRLAMAEVTRDLTPGRPATQLAGAARRRQRRLGGVAVSVVAVVTAVAIAVPLMRPAPSGGGDVAGLAGGVATPDPDGLIRTGVLLGDEGELVLRPFDPTFTDTIAAPYVRTARPEQPLVATMFSRLTVMSPADAIHRPGGQASSGQTAADDPVSELGGALAVDYSADEVAVAGRMRGPVSGITVTSGGQRPAEASFATSGPAETADWVYYWFIGSRSSQPYSVVGKDRTGATIQSQRVFVPAQSWPRKCDEDVDGGSQRGKEILTDISLGKTLRLRTRFVDAGDDTVALLADWSNPALPSSALPSSALPTPIRPLLCSQRLAPAADPPACAPGLHQIPTTYNGWAILSVVCTDRPLAKITITIGGRSLPVDFAAWSEDPTVTVYWLTEVPTDWRVTGPPVARYYDSQGKVLTPR